MTTDANGNIAGDGGALLAGFDSARQYIDENREGVALAIALDTPDFVAGERFAVKMKLGVFEGDNVFGNNGRVTVDAGIGYGLSEGAVGGGVGMQLC